MRSFLIAICAAVVLACVCSVPLSAESIDADVRAAREAERAESMRIEEKIDTEAQPVSVSVTEVTEPVDAETPDDVDSQSAEDDSASVGASDSTASATRASARPSAKSERSAESKASVETDSSDSDDKPAATTAPRRNRPDKVALMLDAEKAKQSGKNQTGAVGTVLWTILKLAVVLVLAYLTILALKWFSTRHEVLPSSHKQFRIVDTLRFNSTSSLHLVEIKGKTLLLGCTAGQVSVLREFEEGELPGDASESGGKFAEYLAKYSDMSAKHGPSGRIAGMLRDCSSYLRDRCQAGKVGVRDEK